MERKIDWSTAPEWAGAVVINEPGELAWVPCFGVLCTGKWLGSGHEQRISMIEPHAWKLVQDRPAEPKQMTWDGEGLPPVGASCETLDEDTGDWVAVRVFAHTQIRGKTHAVAQDENDMFFGLAHDYRLIRTPEQIAAEERDKAACDLFCTINWNDGVSTWEKLSTNRKNDYFKAIDAGYRKQ